MEKLNDYDQDIRVTFKTNDIFSLNQNVYTHILPFVKVSMHNHDYIEFFYVFQGGCQSIINSKTYQFQAGDSALILESDYHTFKNGNKAALHRDIAIKSNYFKMLCDSYSPSFYEDLLNHKYSLVLKLSNSQISCIEAYVSSLQSSPEKKDILERAIVTYLLNLIIASTCKNDNNHNPNWLIQLLSIFNAPANLSTPLPSIVSKFPYTQQYMCRQFKERMGMTMTDYFNDQKIQYAYNLLTTTDMSIQSICNAINLNNVSYFYKLFEAKYGITPAKCKKNTQK